jgi:DNA-binding GntR family transcriptional regulator
MNRTEELYNLNIESNAVIQPHYRRLRDLIRADIIEGRLPSGTRLKIADLATRYASSGIPVREALQQLEGEGIVIFTPNRGACVRQLDDAFLRNIHEIRAVLEPFLIRWFARRRSEAQLALLETVQQDYDIALKEQDFERCMEDDRRFHEICYESHYNEEARIVATRHSGLIRAIATRFPPTLGRIIEAGREHWDLIEKIRIHDEDGAAHLLAEHVRHAGLDMIERLLVAVQPGPLRTTKSRAIIEAAEIHRVNQR